MDHPIERWPMETIRVLGGRKFTLTEIQEGKRTTTDRFIIDRIRTTRSILKCQRTRGYRRMGEKGEADFSRPNQKRESGG